MWFQHVQDSQQDFANQPCYHSIHIQTYIDTYMYVPTYPRVKLDGMSCAPSFALSFLISLFLSLCIFLTCFFSAGVWLKDGWWLRWESWEGFCFSCLLSLREFFFVSWLFLRRKKKRSTATSLLFCWYGTSLVSLCAFGPSASLLWTSLFYRNLSVKKMTSKRVVFLQTAKCPYQRSPPLGTNRAIFTN